MQIATANGGRGFRVIESTDVDVVVSRVKRGVAVTAYDRFLDRTGLTANDVAEVVHLPPRTLVRRRQAGRLSSAESERLYRLSVIFDRAVELHEGSVDAARLWMSASRPALGGQTPLQMCETEVGARAVEDLIGRLQQGVYS